MERLHNVRTLSKSGLSTLLSEETISFPLRGAAQEDSSNACIVSLRLDIVGGLGKSRRIAKDEQLFRLFRSRPVCEPRGLEGLPCRALSKRCTGNRRPRAPNPILPISNTLATMHWDQCAQIELRAQFAICNVRTRVSNRGGKPPASRLASPGATHNSTLESTDRWSASGTP